MRVFVCLVQLALLAAIGCVTVPNLDAGPTATPVLQDRTDCGEILGTAFRSSAERDWFTENCSAWARDTLGPVVTAASANGGQPAPTTTPTSEDVRCAQMRGKPYENADARAWFLANCTPSGARTNAGGPSP
jgi:hypothetical protein